MHVSGFPLRVADQRPVARGDAPGAAVRGPRLARDSGAGCRRPRDSEAHPRDTGRHRSGGRGADGIATLTPPPAPLRRRPSPHTDAQMDGPHGYTHRALLQHPSGLPDHPDAGTTPTSNYVPASMPIERVTGRSWEQGPGKGQQPARPAPRPEPGSSSANVPEPPTTCYERLKPGDPTVDVSRFCGGRRQHGLHHRRRPDAPALSDDGPPLESRPTRKYVALSRPAHDAWSTKTRLRPGIRQTETHLRRIAWFHGAVTWRNSGANTASEDGRRAARAAAHLTDGTLCQ